MSKIDYMLQTTIGLLALAVSISVAIAEDSFLPATPPKIESWDRFVEDLRNLGPQLLSRLPKSMQDDPQIRQEVARLTLESFATMVIKELASDGDHPAFVPWGNVMLNTAQPNADTNYRFTSLTPGGTYRIRGTKGSDRIAKVGQFGSRPAGQGHSWVYSITYDDINQLHTDEQGRFDVILSPTSPKDYSGDWWKLDPATTSLLVRMVADDWTKEKDPELSIERLDAPATRPRATAAQLEERLTAIIEDTARMGALIIDHVPTLESKGYVNKLKAFDVSQIGGELRGQFYYEGAYDLKDDQALILEAKVPEHCLYYSVILTNEIWETTDWYNNHSSLNDSQLHVDKDGVLRVVISAKDPGVANWLDTSGYPRGVVQGRWTECSSQPVPTLNKVTFADIRERLPRETLLMSPIQRDSKIRERRALLQQRPLW